MTAAERNYSMPAKEALAVVHGLHRYEVYIRGQQLILECDHAALVACFTKGESHDRMMNRWLIIIQSFMPFQMRHVDGVMNVADILTRNPAMDPDWGGMSKEEQELIDLIYANDDEEEQLKEGSLTEGERKELGSHMQVRRMARLEASMAVSRE